MSAKLSKTTQPTEIDNKSITPGFRVDLGVSVGHPSLQFRNLAETLQQRLQHISKPTANPHLIDEAGILTSTFCGLF
ncbi:hypothetical protein [Corynebacterium spheniscorum]|uniref:hypothetical protein n=1 Tax=Corynebacterium spheniscorum TaxID=185761 RepID=UPI001160975B|nr:hypothetical protein [Corynebacterium spheniscorum]KAA8722462.1 hypothetical protein F4V56_04625 [Corynebacterium spheniscorum]